MVARIEERALPHRGDDAERDADEAGEEQRHDGKLDGRAEAARR